MRDPTPVVELAPDAPAPLADIVARMMAKPPDDRFQTPAEVAKALQLFATGWWVGPSPAPVIEPARPRADAVSTTPLGDVAEIPAAAQGEPVAPAPQAEPTPPPLKPAGPGPGAPELEPVPAGVMGFVSLGLAAGSVLVFPLGVAAVGCALVSLARSKDKALAGAASVASVLLPLAGLLVYWTLTRCVP